MSKIYLSEHAPKQLCDHLAECGHEIFFVYETGCVSKAVAAHPDIYYCRLHDEIYVGDKEKLSPGYPGDVLYNAAVVGDYIICSKYTDPDLVDRSGCKPVIVKQGYVKCNLVVVDSLHVITEDEGIARAIRKQTDIECLLISPHQVSLPGHPYGFIGGCSGRVGNEMIFNGDLSAHSDFRKITDFISSCGLKTQYFKQYPLTDIGSIIEFRML